MYTKNFQYLSSFLCNCFVEPETKESFCVSKQWRQQDRDVLHTIFPMKKLQNHVSLLKWKPQAKPQFLWNTCKKDKKLLTIVLEVVHGPFMVSQNCCEISQVS